jgi:transcriptional regulator with XRE-family HTH domain
VRDPLLDLMQVIREQHNLTQGDVAKCMGISNGTYRHIEKGRRPLPDIRRGLVSWIRRFEECVQATRDERETILELLSRVVLQEFSTLLDDAQRL